MKDTILEAIHRVRDGTISLSFAIVFAILSSSWYMFTFDKKQFDALLQFVLNTVEAFLGTTRIGGGSTASRLAADYGTISIAISKALYMIIAILAAIGFLWIYVRRFLSTEEVQIPDEYLALATVVFGIFSGTILIPGAWGGGRPLMIVFSLTTIFAVFGAIAIFVVGEAVLGRIWSSGVESVPARMIPANLGASSFASILMVLFLINTGVGVVGGLGDTAPSNVPVVDAQEDSFRETNIATHVWLVDHRSLDERIYGDRQVWAMLDWYAPQIAARQANISRPAYQIRPGSDHLQNLHSKGTRSGYVILHGENVINGRQKIVHQEWRPIGNLSQEFQRRDQIFTTGQSAVLYANKTQSR